VDAKEFLPPQQLSSASNGDPNGNNASDTEMMLLTRGVELLDENDQGIPCALF
jgi:hypothetical protein